MGVFTKLMCVDKHLGVKNVPFENAVLYVNGHSYVINKTKLTEDIKYKTGSCFSLQVEKMGLGSS